MRAFFPIDKVIMTEKGPLFWKLAFVLRVAHDSFWDPSRVESRQAMHYVSTDAIVLFSCHIDVTRQRKAARITMWSRVDLEPHHSSESEPTISDLPSDI